MRHRSRILACSALTVAVLGGCGPSSSTSVDLSGKRFEDRRHQRTVTIDAVDNNFRPQYVTVSIGTKVIFTNVGRNQHNIIPVNDTFTEVATVDFGPGDHATTTFKRAGDSPYFCSLHGTPTRGMNGAIRVVK